MLCLLALLTMLVSSSALLSASPTPSELPCRNRVLGLTVPEEFEASIATLRALASWRMLSIRSFGEVLATRDGIRGFRELAELLVDMAAAGIGFPLEEDIVAI